ncbi:MAG TPA: hypothetical protein RMH85_13955 [Polyangiaceae bacterium LLY-WYZ-15_(1-7)]|nr:hypothetical protein [Myxococcales bacterium]MAT26265.1 hypothetical protein [Sandaracinus sp.]HJK89091.1 hypothetical protein [Polyangiaceae bacterium LLY-WYZ-15_(1-7)]MBJ73966.1 hypothetical protein [Sandaracinus sp.]HJL03488.1 hypothetical protein [Polyangiaceae bacterium LLY-WYZ-15_(1-7)]
MSAPAVRIAEGEGAFVAFDKGVLEVVSPAPFAPGAPLALEVDGRALQAKSLGSKRQEDDRFRVRMRMINLRREDRLYLESLAD